MKIHCYRRIRHHLKPTQPLSPCDLQPRFTHGPMSQEKGHAPLRRISEARDKYMTTMLMSCIYLLFIHLFSYIFSGFHYVLTLIIIWSDYVSVANTFLQAQVPDFSNGQQVKTEDIWQCKFSHFGDAGVQNGGLQINPVYKKKSSKGNIFPVVYHQEKSEG